MNPARSFPARPLVPALLGAALLAACGDSGPSAAQGTRRTTTPDEAKPPAATTAEAPAARDDVDEVAGELSTAYFGAFEPEDVVRGGRAVIPMLSDIDSFNPYLSTSADADHVLGLLYLLPLEEQADYHEGPPTFAPLLVDRWHREGKRLFCHIRDDAVWSDGVPVTSKDVAFSLEAARSPAVAWVGASIVDQIERIEITGPKDYVLHYRFEYPYMEMDSKDWRIVPAHVFGKVPFEDWKSHAWDEAASVVSGPYRVQRYRHNEEFVLVPNEHFWGWEEGIPRLDTLYFRVLSSQQTIYETLLAGELDVQAGVRPKDAADVIEHEDLRLMHYVGRIYGYVGWNCRHPILKDPVVRRALTMAIDRENIVESLFYGYAKVHASPIISSMWAHDRSLAPHPYDPARAAALLAGRGWEKGDDGRLRKDGQPFVFNLSTNTGNEVREAIVQMIQSDLEKLGIEVRPSFQDFNAWDENLRKNKEDAWVGGWNVATKIDPKSTFHSSSFPDGFNFGAYSNPRVDALIERGRVENDTEKARAIWKEWQAIFHEEQPYTILYEARSLNAIRKKFHDVEMNALDPYFNLPEWFIPKAKQARTR